MMDKILLRSKMGRTLYGRLQRTNLPKIFYGWLTKKKVGKVGW